MAAEHWLWLSAVQNVRPSAKLAALRHFGTPEALAAASEAELAALPGLRPAEARHLADVRLDEAGQLLEACLREDVAVLTLEDARYPRRLRCIADPPVVLYVLGALPRIDRLPAVGVVGTRRATPSGLETSRRLAAEIAACGGLVVTGLAAGVDAAAAQGALAAGGQVVGVLGTAVNEIYPRGSAPLFARVRETGALVSEHPPGHKARQWDFSARNRIISGLSAAVLVTEAPEKSGALITAGQAAAQGRGVFAVPGSAANAAAAGANALLRSGAQSALCGWDVMACLAERFPEHVHRPDGPVELPAEPLCPPAARPARTPRASHPAAAASAPAPACTACTPEQLAALSEHQRSIVAVMQRPCMHIDEIIESTGLPAPDVTAELTVLQIAGIVSQQQGKHFTLCGGQTR